MLVNSCDGGWILGTSLRGLYVAQGRRITHLRGVSKSLDDGGVVDETPKSWQAWPTMRRPTGVSEAKA